MKFKEYVNIHGEKSYYKEIIMSDVDELNDWDMTGYYNLYDSYYKIIITNEVFNRVLITHPVKNTKNVFITNYTDNNETLYEFKANISDDLAVISFYDKNNVSVGAKKTKKPKIDAITGVLESVTLLLKLKNDVKRLYFVTVDKDLERFNDSLIKWTEKKIKNIVFDKYEYDAKGRKCYWFRRT